MMADVKTHAYVRVGFKSVTAFSKISQASCFLLNFPAKLRNFYLGQYFVSSLNTSAAGTMTDEQKT